MLASTAITVGDVFNGGGGDVPLELCAVYLYPVRGSAEGIGVAGVCISPKRTAELNMQLPKECSTARREGAREDKLPHLLMGDSNPTTCGTFLMGWGLTDPSAPRQSAGNTLFTTEG